MPYVAHRAVVAVHCADTQANDTHAKVFGIVGAHGLPKRLANAVVAVRTNAYRVSIGNIKPLFTGPLFTGHLPVPPSSPPVPTPRSREPAPAAPARQRPTSPAGSRPALQAQTGWGPGDGQPARRGRRLGGPASNAMRAEVVGPRT